MRIDDCRLMIVDLRGELENERSRQASTLQKSKMPLAMPFRASPGFSKLANARFAFKNHHS
jgi:hypothetical protein